MEMKAFELALVIYITFKHPLLGLACTMILLRQTTVEPMIYHTEKPVRLPLEEQMRAKESNSIHVERPPQEAFTGARPYKEESSKIYTSF
jgi:hypothetical protein